MNCTRQARPRKVRLRPMLGTTSEGFDATLLMVKS